MASRAKRESWPTGEQERVQVANEGEAGATLGGEDGKSWIGTAKRLILR